MMGALAVFHRELLLLRRRALRLLASTVVAPLLYFVAFGYALGRETVVEGHPYPEFLLPGLVAMASMLQAFAIAGEINITRFYWHVFEEIQTSPVSSGAYVIGEVLAGLTRALGAALAVLLLGAAFKVQAHLGPWLWTAVALNGLVFSSLAVCLAMLLRSHSDQMLLSSFVITPMAFLGGTFFPVSRVPPPVALLIELLPLTHASAAIRAAAFGGRPSGTACLALLATAGLLLVAATLLVERAKD